jgi:hypothetical protein
VIDLKIDLKNKDIDKFFSKALEKTKEKGIISKGFSFIKSIFTSDEKLTAINDQLHDFIELALEEEINKHLQNNGLNSNLKNDPKITISIG